MSSYFIYILASKRNGTLYIGVTDNLLRRIAEHKSNIIPDFTKIHNIHSLVYYEECPDIIVAISREKQLKHWKRQWKLKLIEESNPHWKDLYDSLQ